MDLKERLQADLATAMRSGNTDNRNTLRMLLAAIKQVEIDDQVTLDDPGVLAVLAKQAKQRRESIVEYDNAGRRGLAAAEQAELELIESYLPKMLNRNEIKELAVQVIDALGVSDLKAMGQVMGQLMPQLKGKADGRLVNEVVRELLQ